MLDNYPDTKYFRNLKLVISNTSLQDVENYGSSILVAAGQYMNNEITLEEFEQLVPAIEENYVTPEEIKVLNYIRGMLIKSMPIDRSR